MTYTDIENLFKYLAIHFENNPKVHSKLHKNAWFELLEPFDPADVKVALLQCMREKKYFPDPQEVAVKCQIAEPGIKAPPTPAEVEKIKEQVAWMKKFLANQRGGDGHG